MGYYIFVGLLFAVFSISLFAVKVPFFMMSYSTVALLNTVLDTQMHEDDKQKVLIKNLGKVLARLFLFLFTLLAAVGIIILGYYLYSKITCIEQEKLDVSSWRFYLSMLIGSLVLFVPGFFKKKKDYTAWSKLLHRLILDHYNLSNWLFKLDKKSAKKKIDSKQNENKAFVIVSGLARGGTTALTNLLFKTHKFHSLSYRDMPFLMMVNKWRKLYKPKKAKLKQRAHGDQVMFGLDTIEALEEYFFKSKLHDSYIKEDRLEQHTIDEKLYDDYLTYQQIIGLKEKGTVYLAKNNNFMLRYDSLKHYNSNFKVITIYRDPIEHAFSLLTQHQNFKKQQKDDGFVLEYMNWLGHHEFGTNHKRFIFEQIPFNEIKESPDDINYWIQVWSYYHEYILKIKNDNQLILVDYEQLLNDPKALLESLSKDLNIEFLVSDVETFTPRKKDMPKVNEVYLSQALNIYQELKK